MNVPKALWPLQFALVSVIAIAVMSASGSAQSEPQAAYDEYQTLSASRCGNAPSEDPATKQADIMACIAGIEAPTAAERDPHLRAMTLMAGSSLTNEQIEALSVELPEPDATRLMASSIFNNVTLPLDDFLAKYDPLIAKLEADNNQFDLIFLRYRVGVFASVRGDRTRAREEMAWVSEKARSWHYPGLLHSALNIQAVQAVQANEIEEAIELYEQAIAASRAAGDEEYTAIYIMSLGTAFFELRDIDTAMAMYEDALNTINAMPLPNPEKLFWIYKNMADVYSEREAYETAIASYDQALEAAEVSNQPYVMGQARFNKAKAMLASGQNDVAIEQARSALQELEQYGNPAEAGPVHIWLAERYIEDGDYDPAMIALASAKETVALGDAVFKTPDSIEDQNLEIVLDYSRAMANVLNQLGQHEDAIAYANTALELERKRADIAQTKTVGDARLLFNIRQKESQMALLEIDTQLARQSAALQMLRASEARARLGLMAAAALAILTIALLLFRGYRAQRRLARLRQLFLVETNHRAKNNLQMITSLLNMERRKREREGLPDVTSDDFADRAQALALIHEHLYEHNDILEVDAKSFINDLLTFLDNGFGRDMITIEQDVAPIKLDMDQATQIGLLVCEAVTNAYKHAFTPEGGTISVVLSKTDNGLDLAIRDNGKGVSASGSSGDDEPQRGARKSIGMQLIESLAEQLNGKLKVISNEHGTQTQVMNISAPNFSV